MAVFRDYPVRADGAALKDATGRVISLFPNPVEAGEIAKRLNSFQCSVRKAKGKRSVCCAR